jgi:hypothetical protein
MNLDEQVFSSPPADNQRTIPPPSVGGLSLEEAVKLSAVHTEFFGHFFFPRTFRVPSPPFHREIFNGLEHPLHRYFAAEVFRDGAKTSLLRVYAAKRISFSLSRTVVFVGKSEDQARRSVEWIMHQVDRNSKWASSFGLSRGGKWTSTELEIMHGVDEVPIVVLALGITGSTRGINIEDYRPDLIIVDDPCDLENTATPEQRQKMNEHFFGAIYHSLAPAEDSSLAKLVLLQTPLNREDLVNACIRDPLWHGVVFGCFDERGESRWPQRKPTEMLLREKEGYAARNQLSIWLREMECKIVSPETTAFKAEWLKKTSEIPSRGGIGVLGVDPVPPPSEVQIAKGLRGKDEEVLAYVRRVGDDYYVDHISANRGHEPDWTVAEFMAICLAKKPFRVVVESNNYQRTLAWIFRRAMKAQREYFVVEEIDDRRKKFDRIVDALSGIASAGHLHCRPEHLEFIEQFNSYPDVSHDDQLDAVAIAVMKLSGLDVLARTSEDGEDPYLMADHDRLALRMGGGVP